MSDRKALPGDPPPKRDLPELKEHDWDTGSTQTPGWLNPPTCRRCGCTLTTGSVVFAGVKVTSGQEYTYRTVTGKEIRSFKPLSCPLFGFDALSAAMESKEMSREAKIELAKVDVRMEGAEYQIRQIQAENKALHEAMMYRLTQLENENQALRDQVNTVTQIDLTQLAEKLFELAEAAKAKKMLEPVESKGRVVQIPKELADVIDVIGIPIEAEILDD